MFNPGLAHALNKPFIYPLIAGVGACLQHTFHYIRVDIGSLLQRFKTVPGEIHRRIRAPKSRCPDKFVPQQGRCMLFCFIRFKSDIVQDGFKPGGGHGCYLSPQIFVGYQIGPEEVVGNTDQRQIGIFLSIGRQEFQIINQ